MVISLEPKKVPSKTLYRGSQSLIALGRWEEARDLVKRGMRLEEGDARVWKDLMRAVEDGERRIGEKIERERREKVGKEALRRAVVVSFLFGDVYAYLIYKWLL